MGYRVAQLVPWQAEFLRRSLPRRVLLYLARQPRCAGVGEICNRVHCSSYSELIAVLERGCDLQLWRYLVSKGRYKLTTHGLRSARELKQHHPPRCLSRRGEH